MVANVTDTIYIPRIIVIAFLDKIIDDLYVYLPTRNFLSKRRDPVATIAPRR